MVNEYSPKSTAAILDLLYELNFKYNFVWRLVAIVV